MKNCIFLFVIFIVAITSVKAFDKCKMDDSDCLNSAIQGAIKSLAAASSEYDTPSLDPIHIDTITVAKGAGPVAINQNYKDMNIYNLPDSKISKAKFDSGSKTLTFSSFLDVLVMNSTYDFEGQLMSLPFYGKGGANSNLYNITFDHTIKLEEDGKFYKVASYVTQFDIGIFSCHFENLFNGNKELAQNMNKLLNENWRDVFEDVRPGYATMFGNLFKIYADKVFAKIPIAEFFA